MTLPADQPSTAMILDGIYSQAANAGAGAFLDVAQVEVLKGPQGTLFGRNATAGAILVNSQRPEFATSAQLQADVGNYSKTNADAVVNFAVGQHIAVRAAGQLAQHDGYYEDGSDDEDSQSARLKVLFAPTDELSVLLSGNYARQSGAGTGSMPISNATGELYVNDPWAGASDSANQIAAFPTFNGRYGADARMDNVNRGANAELNWTLGAATLTSLASYQGSDRAEVEQDYDAISIKSIEKSFETRWASNDDTATLKWLVGLYYYHQNLYGNAFGAVQSITADASGTSVSSANPGGYDPRQLALPPRDSLGAEASWNPITWKAAIDFDVTEHSMAYLMVATGWKGGAPAQCHQSRRQTREEQRHRTHRGR